MLSLPETVSWIEVAWMAASAIAIGAGLIARRWARADYDFVVAEYVDKGRGRHIARAFKRDCVNVRARLLLAIVIETIGVIASTQPNHPPTPSGWVIVGLLFTMPLYLVWKTAAEATERRRELQDVARAYRNGGDP